MPTDVPVRDWVAAPRLAASVAVGPVGPVAIEMMSPYEAEAHLQSLCAAIGLTVRPRHSVPAVDLTVSTDGGAPPPVTLPPRCGHVSERRQCTLRYRHDDEHRYPVDVQPELGQRDPVWLDHMAGARAFQSWARELLERDGAARERAAKDARERRGLDAARWAQMVGDG